MVTKYLIEFLATLFFVYVFLATGNGLAIGATLALVVILCKNMAAGFVNPAVVIVMSSAGQLPVNEIIPYCVAEIFGGLVALEIYKRYRL